MSPLVIGVVVLSCFMHAGWNLLGRQHGRDVLPFFLRMNLLTMLLGLLPALAAQRAWHTLDPHAWLLCAVSGVSLGSYYFFLGKSYEGAELSTVYPVVRSLPVLLLAGVDAARSRLPSPVALLGMALVMVGCVLAPRTSWRDMRLQPYLTRSSLWMILTALAITGYSVCDKVAAETPAAQQDSLVFALVYGAFLFTFGTGTLALLTTLSSRGRPRSASPGWRVSALAAVLNGGSYAMILWAYQHVSEVSSVVALRQFSVVIGVGVALWIFQESGRGVRSVATLLILFGLIMVGLTGS